MNDTHSCVIINKLKAQIEEIKKNKEIEKQKELDKTEITNGINKLINFFSEFSFEPNFRFVNTFCLKLQKSKFAAKEYISNYNILVGIAHLVDLAISNGEILSSILGICYGSLPAFKRLYCFYQTMSLRLFNIFRSSALTVACRLDFMISPMISLNSSTFASNNEYALVSLS